MGASAGPTCPKCRRAGKVTSTQVTDNNIIRRNRVCPAGHLFKTYEIPAAVYRSSITSRNRIAALKEIIRTEL